MKTRRIICAYCGREGFIDVWGSGDYSGSAGLFQYIGYNPISGHMHFQCPECAMVFLVNPLDVLRKGVLTADCRTLHDHRSPWCKLLAYREDHGTHPGGKRQMVN